MSAKRHQSVHRVTALITAAAVLLMPLMPIAQTRISPPKNGYSPSQDVQLGRQAVAEVERQMPILPEGSEVDGYVEGVGQRLVAAIPPEYQHPEFRYEFDVVNARDINAFALPGGPMYVNRGMIEQARTEGEMAGVMAHEIAHVALRHGTAQATKSQSAKAQLPAIGGAILGAIIGGTAGGVIAQGAQIGAAAYILKYSREYETQADILGAQIMARAGYDPRDLANMFRTIEQQSGGRGGPEWLSSHPNPGNRFERINQEAGLLRVSPSRGSQDSYAFNRVRSSLRGMSPAPTMEEIARSGQRSPQGSRNEDQRYPQSGRNDDQRYPQSGRGGRNYPNDSRVEGRVEYPSARYRTYNGGNLFRVSVPENWREFADQNSVTFAPQGAFGDHQGQSVFTHGAIVGVVQTQGRNLRQASDEYISGLLQSNSYLQQQGNYRRGTVDGRNALTMTLAGRSQVTGRNEMVTVYTTLLSNGALFYMIGVAPQNEYRSYDQAFQNMLRSVEINAN